MENKSGSRFHLFTENRNRVSRPPDDQDQQINTSVHGSNLGASASVDKQVRFTYRIMARIGSFEAGVYWTP
jgi:hypothetical protein